MEPARWYWVRTEAVTTRCRQARACAQNKPGVATLHTCAVLLRLAVTMQGIQYQHILPLSLFLNSEPEITAHELLGNERKLH